MKVYEYTNPHPKGIKTLSDCVYRAISIATGKTWLEVYDELTALGRDLLSPANDPKTYKDYLDKIADPLPAMVNGKRLTGKDLAKEEGTYVIQTAHHLSTVKDGKVRDTWDSSNKSAYRVWRIR